MWFFFKVSCNYVSCCNNKGNLLNLLNTVFCCSGSNYGENISSGNGGSPSGKSVVGVYVIK